MYDANGIGLQHTQPLPKRQVHFTCGPSRSEAEHHQPRFGEVRPSIEVLDKTLSWPKL